MGDSRAVASVGGVAQELSHDHKPYTPGKFPALLIASIVLIYIYICVCDRLWINHPSTAKCKFWVRPKITAKSARGRYLVYVVGVIYGVLATLCRSTKRQLSIVSPGGI